MKVQAVSPRLAAARRDASMQKELGRLQTLPGQISARQMATAIIEGTADRDAAAATTEQRTLARWVMRHQDKLGPGARGVVAAYAKLARQSRAAGEHGFSPARVAELKRTLGQLSSSKPSEPKSPPTPPSEPKSPPARPGGAVERALADPNAFFKRQGFHQRYNDFREDHPDRARDLGHNSNCGPTSLAMAVKVFGLESPGSTTQQSIDRVRRAMTGNINDDVGTNSAETARGARQLGLQAERFDPEKGNSFDEQLAKGRMVVVHGRTTDAYKQGIRRTDPGYSLRPILHAVLVMGKDESGRYLVADPLSRKGVARLTRAELSSYWNGERALSTAVWR